MLLSASFVARRLFPEAIDGVGVVVFALVGDVVDDAIYTAWIDGEGGIRALTIYLQVSS